MRSIHNHGKYYYRTNTKLNGKRILKTWIQRRCIICQRFLSKTQQRYCSKCKPLIVKKEKLVSYHKCKVNKK